MRSNVTSQNRDQVFLSDNTDNELENLSIYESASETNPLDAQSLAGGNKRRNDSEDLSEEAMKWAQLFLEMRKIQDLIAILESDDAGVVQKNIATFELKMLGYPGEPHELLTPEGRKKLFKSQETTEEKEQGGVKGIAVMFEIAKIVAGVGINMQPHELSDPEKFQDIKNAIVRLPQKDFEKVTAALGQLGLGKLADALQKEKEDNAPTSLTSQSSLLSTSTAADAPAGKMDDRFEKICTEFRKAKRDIEDYEFFENEFVKNALKKNPNDHEKAIDDMCAEHQVFLEGKKFGIDDPYHLTKKSNDFCLNDVQISDEQAAVIGLKRYEACNDALCQYRATLTPHDVEPNDEKFTFTVKGQEVSFDIKKDKGFKDIKIPAIVNQSMIVSLAPRDGNGDFIKQGVTDDDKFQVCYNKQGKVILLIPDNPDFDEKNGQMFVEREGGTKFYYPVSKTTFQALQQKLPDIERKQSRGKVDDILVGNTHSHRNTPSSKKFRSSSANNARS